jgi:hypothetical protein
MATIFIFLASQLDKGKKEKEKRRSHFSLCVSFFFTNQLKYIYIKGEGEKETISSPRSFPVMFNLVTF